MLEIKKNNDILWNFEIQTNQSMQQENLDLIILYKNKRTVPQDENNWNQKILEIPQPCSRTKIAKTMLVRFEPVIGSTLGVVSKGAGIKFG